MEYINKFRHLGWNQKQTEVYLALLQTGPATAYQVAKRSGMKRPTVYVVLDELRRLDAVLVTPKAAKQIYTAKPPQTLVGRAVDGLNDLIASLPAISALMAQGDKPTAQYFEGFIEIARLLNFDLDRSAGDEVVGFYAYNERLPKRLIKLFDEHNDQMRERRISVRGIVPEHPSLGRFRQSDPVYRRVMKIVPFKDYSSKISVDMGRDYVRLIDFEHLQGTLIDNKLISESMRQVFELLWSRL